MMYKVINWFITRFKKLSEHGTITIENVATAMTLTVTIGLVVVVTGNTIIQNTEEETHIHNARIFSDAVKMIMGQDPEQSPNAGANTSFSLLSLYQSEFINKALDPSGEKGAAYDPNNTLVKVVSEQGAHGYIFKFYVDLVASGNSYAYIKETVDTGVDVDSLTKEHVNIPDRDKEGRN